MSEPVLFDRNGEPIYVGDRFVWDEPGFDKVSGSVADSSGILWDGDDSGYIDRHPLWFKPNMYQHYTKLKEPTMTEPLVRIGRTDLWARGDTEINDGRVVAKAGETAVTILTTTLGGLFSCAYQRRGTIISIRPSGKVNTDGSESRLDLIELSPAPKIMLWEFHEIPVGHWFRRKGSPVAFPCGPVDESDGTISVDDIWLNVRELLLHYEHCPTHCGEFQPCGKTI